MRRIGSGGGGAVIRRRHSETNQGLSTSVASAALASSSSEEVNPPEAAPTSTTPPSVPVPKLALQAVAQGPLAAAVASIASTASERIASNYSLACAGLSPRTVWMTATGRRDKKTPATVSPRPDDARSLSPPPRRTVLPQSTRAPPTRRDDDIDVPVDANGGDAAERPAGDVDPAVDAGNGDELRGEAAAPVAVEAASARAVAVVPDGSDGLDVFLAPAAPSPVSTLVKDADFLVLDASKLPLEM